MERLDVGDAANAVPVAPAEKVANRPVVRHAVFLLRMVAAKNSRNRRAAWSPASAITRGTTMPSRLAPARVRAGVMGVPPAVLRFIR